jgi:hypothetical protein
VQFPCLTHSSLAKFIGQRATLYMMHENISCYTEQCLSILVRFCGLRGACRRPLFPIGKSRQLWSGLVPWRQTIHFARHLRPIPDQALGVYAFATARAPLLWDETKCSCVPGS